LSDDECGYDFKWPVPGNYYVSSGVGARWGTYHKGLDITGDSGTAICAAEAGTVVTVNNSCTHNYGKSSSCGCGGGYGNFVIIDHGNGFLTLYGHMTKALVSVGDTVKQGEQIGTMGTTGYSTGTHLHFELRYNGYITNPAAFLKL
jgi:murein DD-endopeptidase MepM/ murein hydrolase activator NlpD